MFKFSFVRSSMVDKKDIALKPHRSGLRSHPLLYTSSTNLDEQPNLWVSVST
jgi:hypothetical protein